MSAQLMYERGSKSSSALIQPWFGRMTRRAQYSIRRTIQVVRDSHAARGSRFHATWCCYVSTCGACSRCAGFLSACMCTAVPALACAELMRRARTSERTARGCVRLCACVRARRGACARVWEIDSVHSKCERSIMPCAPKNMSTWWPTYAPPTGAGLASYTISHAMWHAAHNAPLTRQDDHSAPCGVQHEHVALSTAPTGARERPILSLCARLHAGLRTCACTQACTRPQTRVCARTRAQALPTHTRTRMHPHARARPHGNARALQRYEESARHGARTLHAIKRIGTLPPASTDL